MAVYIIQLPNYVQEEMRKDIREILGVDDEDKIDDIMSNKLVDVIGFEEGLLPYRKYSRWLSEMTEDKQKICDAMLNALRLTRAAGSGNELVELRYIVLDSGDEVVRPIFKDGCGEDGWYDVNVNCDSGIAVITDIVRQFVNKVW